MESRHLNLVRKLTWSFHRTTGIDWEELFAEATLAYYEKMKKYKPSKGAESTWIYIGVQSRLMRFIKREHKNTFLNIEENGIDLPFYQEPFFEFFDALSEDSKVIAEMVINNPMEYLQLPSKMARGLVACNLVDRMGWTYTRVRKAVRTIKKEIFEIC